ncbi:MAG: alpha/beta hydrolase [bacterium]
MRQFCKSLRPLVLVFLCFYSIHGAAQEFLIDSKIPFYGDLVTADNEKDVIFLIIHGTFAHKDMELIQALQDGLSEQSYSSLAITLPLGIPRRKGFQDCQNIASHTHNDALISINAALKWLAKNKPHQKVALIGHSRGANQAVLYSKTHTSSILSVIAIAPMVFEPSKIIQVKSDQQSVHLKTFLHCKNVDVPRLTAVSYQSDLNQDTPHLLKKPGVPVLVIFGDEDPLYERFMEKSKQIKLKIEPEVVVGSDHFFRDLYTEDVVDLTLSFIEGI